MKKIRGTFAGEKSIMLNARIPKTLDHDVRLIRNKYRISVSDQVRLALDALVAQVALDDGAQLLDAAMKQNVADAVRSMTGRKLTARLRREQHGVALDDHEGSGGVRRVRTQHAVRGHREAPAKGNEGRQGLEDARRVARRVDGAPDDLHPARNTKARSVSR